jgi:hypothetical protein
MADTMLRSGVPPHIGQSPVPGSEAATCEAVIRTIANRTHHEAHEDHEGHEAFLYKAFFVIFVIFATFVTFVVMGPTVVLILIGSPSA